MKQWYTAHTRPNLEQQVAAIWRQRGFNTYLPQVRVCDRQNQLRWAPFFPTYLFFEADFAVVGTSDLKWTPGLKYLVTFDEDLPIPVPAATIEQLRRELSQIEIAGGWEAYKFQPGDKVRIMQGPLNNMTALFERSVTPNGRVQILLTYLGQVKRVQMDAMNLQRVENQSARSDNKRRTRGRGRYIHYASD